MERKKIYGLVLFGILVVVVAVAAIFALNSTGIMGIEDRYNQAVGLALEEGGLEGGTHEAGGFSLEGNPLIYLGILVLLIVISLVLYRQFTINH